jgi:hypothetical protein
MRRIFTVIESTGSGQADLVSLEDAKLQLGITDDEDDEALAKDITRVSKSIGEYCNRLLSFEDVVETFIFDEFECVNVRQPLVLRQYPVDEVSEIKLNNVVYDGAFDIDKESGLIWKDGGWSGRVEISYSGGYNLPDDAPAALQVSALEVLTVRRTISDRDPALRSVTHGESTVSYWNSISSSTSGFTSDVIDALAKFRRFVV